jgi:phosphohistidine phosphatase SixA
MAKITLIRHAQSKFNAGTAKTLAEITNSRITEKGIQQASQLNFDFDLLILSPLKRSMETYTNSNIKTKKVIISEFFREHMSSPLNFLELEDHQKLESEKELLDRVDRSLAYLKLISNDYSHIGIISHSDFLRKITLKLLGKELVFNNCGSISINI